VSERVRDYDTLLTRDADAPSHSFKYIIANKGVDTEASYPYTAKDGTCRYNAANKGATISSYKNVQKGSESALETATASVGPISVAIDASHPSFQAYKSGIYYEPKCSSTQLDHGVLVVGYGSQNGQVRATARSRSLSRTFSFR